MSDAASESAHLEALAGMVADHRRGELLPLERYVSAPGVDAAALARSYLELVDADANAATSAQAEDSHVGHFELLEELGRGSQGVVWLARDTRLDRNVALKVTRRPPGASAPARLLREALVGADWDHPGLCPVLDVGSDAHSSWIAMRHVDGVHLADWARSRGWREVARAIARVARAVDHAHESGVVHRDIKPVNVLVSALDQPVLVDFGVASIDRDGAAPLTETGAAVGTPAYMAPEEFELNGADPGPGVDVWALGVCLYELLTGRRPFDAPTRTGVLRAIAQEEPERLRTRCADAPRDLEVIVETLLAKDPAERYGSAAAAASDLEALLDGRPIAARPVGPLGRAARWARRRPAQSALAAALVLSLAGGLAAALVLLTDRRDALDRRNLALEKVEGLLSEVTRLADRDATAALLSEEPGLWPVHPRRTDDMARWIERAEEVLGREDDHREARAVFERAVEAEDPTDERVQRALGRGRIDDQTGAWLLGLVDLHLADLEVLRERLDSVRARHGASTTLAARTVESKTAEWEAARARLAADPRFEGVELAPQVGLVPLGPDPASGLEEFAVASSGAVPTRADDGTLERSGEMAVVLVLLPGGVAACGSDRPIEERPLGGPFVDPHGLYQEGPHHSCELEPFLLGKYEVTQGQWLRQMGVNPSQHTLKLTKDLEKMTDEDTQLSLPVESVSGDQIGTFLARLDLAFPTETQWEYGARAGTSTIWWTGNEPASLNGAENLADKTAKAAVGPQGQNYETFIDDGWIGTSPVGSFRANPWGLHDVAGNVLEYCADTLEDWHHVLPVPPEGRIPNGVQTRMPLRGAACVYSTFAARSSYRVPEKAHVQNSYGGARAARRLER
ncbi:MAG: SUMF1/EgtB/PvdO family nonheme iron enzyme [Planctomycetota bacterium]